MSGVRDRCRQVERQLADRGIQARVESVGEGGAIALVRPEKDTVERLVADKREEIFEVCSAAGYRNAAVELFWE